MKKILSILLIILLFIYYISFVYIINKYDLTVVCNDNKTYCSWFFNTKISQNISESDFKMYDVYNNPWVTTIFNYYKLLYKDPLYIIKKLLFSVSLLVWIIVPYIIYNYVNKKLQ